MLGMKTTSVVLALLFAASCSKDAPTAMGVCQKIEAAGVAKNCKESKPGGLGAAAIERADFDLPSVAGKTGSVLRFDRESTYTSTEEAYAKAAMLAGPHRYGSKKSLIFVQMNEGLGLPEGKKVKELVDSL